MSLMMFKISEIETYQAPKIVSNVANLLVNLKFDVNVGTTNSKQITSNIDVKISDKLKKKYSLIVSKNDLEVYAEGNRIGQIDIAFKDNRSNVVCYIEIEKTNIKTLWFDYIKLLSIVQNDTKKIGVIICPKNYAHKINNWNLYEKAVAYKKHLARISNNKNLNRIGIIGYTQFAYLNRKWRKFDPEVIKQLKTS